MSMSPSRISRSPDTTSNAAFGASSASSTDSRLEIDGSRPRQTERPAAPFRSVLTAGASLLMSGAEVATHVIGGPVLAAAVHDARVGANAALGGPGAAVAATTPLAGAGGPASALGGAAGSPASVLAAAASPQPEVAGMEAMMQAGQASNMQLLALQEQVQQENQRFSTISNVMRAKHDTAKAAVSNIRA